MAFVARNPQLGCWGTVFLASRQKRPGGRRCHHLQLFDFAWKFDGGLYIQIKMRNLTKQEQFVLCLILLILLTGWAVKVYRTAHAPMTPLTQQRP